MKLHQQLFPKCLRWVVILITLVVFAVVPGLTQSLLPSEVSSEGYINGAPLTTHTTGAFNTVGSSTLVAFVSTNTPWNGVPVSISGVSDNQGNTWSVLAGPTQFNGSQFPLVSEIYYVNVPATNSAHTVTVQLTNPAPLVVHVFAVSGSDISGPPIYSAITDPGSGATSASVVTAPITVPANTLLLSWAKNETNGNATAIDGYTLDGGSTSFLWAETETAVSTGSYTGNFQYDSNIGWQTAIVGFRPGTVGPVAFTQAVTAGFGTPTGITLTGESPSGFALSYSVVTGPAQGTLSGSAPNLTYTPNAGYSGQDAFTFKVNDGTGDSNTATVSITVRAPNHAPVATDSSGTSVAGTPAAAMLNATDADGDPLIYIIVSAPAHGQLSSGTGPNRTYTPNAGYVGNDSFTFKANDGQADSNVATVSITVATAVQMPAKVGSVGYIDGTPLTTHTTGAFNSVGATTLVAFVSTNTPWNGLPVSISGVTDNLGNTWSVLTGPTQWTGSSFTLLSGVYYVNAPVTGGTHTVTVNLTNGAPLVVHVFAASGSDISGPPVYSAITNPGTGGVSATVTTAPITVPANSLLVSWAKNETSGNATAIDGYTLDGGSTSFLWAESEIAFSTGSYTGDFQYDSAIGWQTAILGLKPAAGGPVAFNQSVTTSLGTPAGITLAAESPGGFALTYSVVSPPAHGVLSGTAPNVTYTPNAGYSGSDAFTFKANDGTGDSNTATVSISVHSGSQLPAELGSIGYTNSTALTTHTTGTFNSTGASTLVMFIGSHNPWNGLPVSINGVSDNTGNGWKLLAGPTLWNGETFPLLGAVYYVNLPATSSTHTVTVQLSNPAPLVMHIFAVSGSDTSGPPIVSPITDPGAGAVSASVVTAPITVPANSLLLSWAKNEAGANATAIDGYTLDAASVSFLWGESAIASADGSYTGDFVFDSAIGWQTAIVGLPPATNGPTAFSQAVTVTGGAPVNITLTAHSPGGFPLNYSVISQPSNGTLSGVAPNLTYTPNVGFSGSDAFTFKANDGTADTNLATVSITVPVLAPTINGVSPNGGPTTGGTVVTITGTNFVAGATVAIGAEAATSVAVINSSTIIATTPAASAGAVTATVINPGGQAGSLAGAFTYIGPPTATNVSPNSGSTAGGTPVAITGTNFAAGTTVKFGTATATGVTIVNGTTITATTPAGSAGAVTVTLTNSIGQTATLANAFTYIAPPTVTSVSPTSGSTAGGTAITVRGTNFASGAIVKFGTATATSVVVTNSTTITATTPAGSTGAVTVTVTNSNGLNGTLANAFTYVAPPTITSISPNSGTTAGGTSVTITGSNFASGAAVKFGSTAGTSVVIVNSTTITAKAPAGSAGAVTVTVTNSNGLIGTLANAFTYVAPPTVSSLSPTSGSTLGGTAVIVRGTNFAAGTTVKFGTIAATNVVIVNSAMITATTPAGGAGAVTVTITNSNGLTGSLANGYTYIVPPAVTGVSPATGATGGGTIVTITGTNFASGASVKFGTATATSVVLTSTTILAVTPGVGAPGAVTVTVTNSNGLSGTRANAFTYH